MIVQAGVFDEDFGAFPTELAELMRWTQPLHNLKRPLKGQDGKPDHPNRG